MSVEHEQPLEMKILQQHQRVKQREEQYKIERM